MSQQAKAAAALNEAAELKSFGRPDEVRTFPKDRLELIKIGGATIGRAGSQFDCRPGDVSRRRFLRA